MPPVFPLNTLAVFGIKTLDGYESIKPKTKWWEAGYATDPETLERMGVTVVVGEHDALDRYGQQVKDWDFATLWKLEPGPSR
jgi:hypothetical protein